MALTPLLTRRLALPSALLWRRFPASALLPAIKAESCPEALILTVPGTALNRRIAAALRDTLRPSMVTATNVILDLRHVDTVDTHGLSFLLESVRHLGDRGALLCVTGLTPGVRRLCQAGFVHRRVQIFNTTDEARAAMRLSALRTSA